MSCVNLAINQEYEYLLRLLVSETSPYFFGVLLRLACMVMGPLLATAF